MEPFDRDQEDLSTKKTDENVMDTASHEDGSGHDSFEDEELVEGAYEDRLEDDYDDGDDDEDIEWEPEQTWEPDERAKDALSFLSQVVDSMGMNVSVHLRKPEEGGADTEIHLDMSGHDTGRVIGKKGQVLAALQYLVNRSVNRHGMPRRHVILDAEGYRQRREESLSTMARQLGEQAAREGKIITFEPMSPRDRRVVHLALAKFEDVVTKSDGEGDERRVRIIPVRR